MKKAKRILSLLLAVAMLVIATAGCGSNNNQSSTPANSSKAEGGTSSTSNTGTAPERDISEKVTLSYYMYGSEGVANPDILAEVNKMAEEELNCTLEVKYIDWGDVATKYPLLFASGEKFDIVEASPTFAASYWDIAADGALADITDLIDLVPDLKAEVPERYWDYVSVNGKVYGVPTLYVAFNAYGLVTRQDYQEKYNIPEINSFETAEAYFDACLADGIVPLNGNAGLANDMYRTFLATTGTWWPEVPGINQGELSLAATSLEKYDDIFHPAYTDEFMEWCKKMKEWSDKGYWSKDVMAASAKDDKDNFLANNSGAFITHQPDWTGAYGSIKSPAGSLGPDVDTNFWCYTLDNDKMKRMPCTENICAISSTSDHPDRALMLIEKFMTDERYYRLLQMGIEGRQYDLVDGTVTTAATYDEAVDAGGFCSWSLRNDRLNLPFASEDPRRAVQNKEWDKIAHDDPYIGFAFDATNVSAEISAISNVNSTYGNQLMLGKSTKPVEEAVEEYRTQLTQAGVDKVIEEVKSQLEAWKASK